MQSIYSYDPYWHKTKIAPKKFYSILSDENIHFMVEMVECVRYCFPMIIQQTY